MKRRLGFLLGWICSIALPAAASVVPVISTEALTAIPRGKGLPITVTAGLYFVEVTGIDDNTGRFSATVDLRLRWQDLRLQFPPELAPSGFRSYRDAALDARLSEIWSPDIALSNLVGAPNDERKGLRLYPDGRAELMVRTSGEFQTAFDVEKFPFDRQKLTVEIASGREPQELVVIDFRQSELDFSRVAPNVEIDGWRVGLVEIRRTTEAGWYGESHARIEASLGVARLAGGSVAAIFVPLLASLLIPLLAMWLNKVEDGEFQIEAFELANIIIGGLFAVIALNFTINSEFHALAGENTVSRLFVLNYLTLAASLLINLLLFRFNVVKRLCGKYVQEQFYAYLAWAQPLLVAITAGAIILSARV